ncbi:MAG TPA: adenylate/guanylate cyclase domain-containing protein [Burkholderiales bacterium]|nr:adenylate/guanylate cyclase domain-containing protein [Burkholderiales bacterium]
MAMDGARREGERIALGGLRDALVMMVDDDPLVIELTQAFLGKAGYRRFMSTCDSSAAVAMLLRELPDVVLLDLNMPRVSGFDVLASMRIDPVLKHIPAIVLTSADDPETRLKALDLGASDFLRKPVDPSELALRLRNTLAAKAHREAIRKAFVRYVSPRLAEGIINDASAPFASPAQRAEMVALFADLRGFTRITETIDVEHLVEMLNEYFTVLTEAAYRHDGTIFNMAGDCLLVGFNVPFLQPDAATRAWRTAVDMLSRFATVAAGWRARHGVATGVGIGICQGQVFIGNVGSPHYMSYTVIGNTVNTAARLMETALMGEVLVSAAFYEAVRRLVPENRVESRGEVALRGKAETVQVYSIRP